jgi:hypothetical protein
VYTDAPYLARFFPGDQKTKTTKTSPSLALLFPYVYIQYASVNVTWKHVTKKTKA